MTALYPVIWMGLPQHALRFLFPKLWPAAEADASDSAL